MKKSFTDERTFVGVVVDDLDDQEQGRCKIAIPSTMGPNLDISKLPWSQMASQSDDQGSLTFNRPPQVGSLVMAYAPGGTKSSGEYIVTNVLNHIPAQDRAISGNLSLSQIGWFFSAISTIPSGVQLIQNIVQTVDGVNLTDRPVPSILELSGMPTNANPALVKAYSEVTNVATASLAQAQAMTASIASLIPGTAFSLGNLLTSMSSGLQNEVLESMNSEVAAGLQNLTTLMTTFTPVVGNNFTQISNNINPSTFFNSAASILSGARNYADLQSRLLNIANNAGIRNLSGLSASLTIDGPFGDIDLTINSDGSIDMQLANGISDLISQFFGGFSAIAGAVRMLQNSSLQNVLMDRMTISAASTMKSKLTTVASSTFSPGVAAAAFF